MRRAQLEHVIRAASGITGATELVIIGSQAILGHFPSPPDSLCVSMEADVFTFRDPADADLIDGCIGEGSPFHQTFGYYAHGVSEETAILPECWKQRLVRLQNENTGTGVGLCLEMHDLTVAKLMAGREKDFDFVAELLRHRLVKPEIILQRLEATSVDDARRSLCRDRLKRLSVVGERSKE
ncbi:MAG: hypothetical protein JNN07_13325 [Verrucomicrobiales bacterium]|nr:hypothetical protein [Verrucomicrobiales bacterium]